MASYRYPITRPFRRLIHILALISTIIATISGVIWYLSHSTQFARMIGISQPSLAHSVPSTLNTPHPTSTPRPTSTTESIYGVGVCSGLCINNTATVYSSSGEGFNIRTDPNTGATILKSVDSGDVVRLLAGPRVGSGYTWWQIETIDGYRGWMVESINDNITLIPGGNFLTMEDTFTSNNGYTPTTTLTLGTPNLITLPNGRGTGVELSLIANGYVSITAKGINGVDTTLEVLDANGNSLGYNDDHDTSIGDLGALDSALENLAINGRVTVHISKLGETGGQVEVYAELSSSSGLDTTEPMIVNNPTIVLADTPTILNLHEGLPAVVSFSGNGMYTIEVRALDGTDVYVTVTDNAGFQIGYNDDHGTTRSLAVLDSAIENLAINGEITIEVDRYNTDLTNVELIVITEDAFTSNNGYTPTTTLTLGTPNLITLPNGRGTGVELSLIANGYVVITAKGINGVDTTLEVLDANGNSLGYNDDHDTSIGDLGALDSALENLAINGRVTVHISKLGETGGQVEVYAELSSSSGLDTTEPMIVNNPTIVLADTPTILNLHEGLPAVVSFSGNGMYTIEVRALDGADVNLVCTWKLYTSSFVRS